MLFQNVQIGNPRQNEYLTYLVNHISNVRRAWDEQLGPVIMNFYPESYAECERSIMMHDHSKYDDEEFDAYCNYFYPSEGFPKDEEAFDKAWLRHQNMNPHHWQHWVLIRDSGDFVPQDMPLEEVCNMLCDWHSFSSKDNNSTAYNWYEENKDKMILSDRTREFVTFLLQYLIEPLSRR